MKEITYQEKKGIPLQAAFGAVLTLVLVSVLVIIAIYLFTSLGSSTLVDNSGTQNFLNESIVATPSGAVLVGGGLLSPVCRIGFITNGTSPAIVTSGNYTQSGTGGCTITNTTSTFSVGASPTWLVTYNTSYDLPTAAYNASQTTTVNFSGYPALVGLVGTIIFLGLVIGVLVGSFVGGRATA